MPMSYIGAPEDEPGYWDDKEPSEEETEEDERERRACGLCRNCEGTGIAGRVTPEMALDAGDAQLEDRPATCWFCDGTGQFEPERDERKEHMQQLGIIEEDVEETRNPLYYPESH